MRCFWGLVFFVFTIASANGVSIYERKLTDWESSRLGALKACSLDEIVKRFEACSRNVIQGAPIDSGLHSLIKTVASNPHGKRYS